MNKLWAWTFVASLPAQIAEPARPSGFLHPIRLEADGKPIQLGRPARIAAPCFLDVDADGLVELLLADGTGRILVHPNRGRPGAPLFGTGTPIVTARGEVRIRDGGSSSLALRVADLDDNGEHDLVVGSCATGKMTVLFRQGGVFSDPEVILDRDGDPLGMGAWFDEASGGYLHLDRDLGVSCTPWDWEGDGDLDVIWCSVDGLLRLTENVGTRKQAVFTKPGAPLRDTAGSPLRVPGKHGSVECVDWNGDGTWDMVTGSAAGTVSWFPNRGSRERPRFEAAEPIHDPRWAKVPSIWHSSSVAVIDYDADGVRDLVVGDRLQQVFDTESPDNVGGRVWLFYGRRGQRAPWGVMANPGSRPLTAPTSRPTR